MKDKIRTYFNDLKMIRKLLLSFIIVILLFLVIGVALSYFSISSFYTRQVNAVSENYFTQTVKNLENLVESNLYAGYIVQNSPEIQELCTNRESDIMLEYSEIREIQDYIFNISTPLSIYRITVYVPDDRPYTENNMYFKKISDLESYECFKQLISGRDICVWMPMENISDRDQGGQILVNSILRKIGDFNDPVGFQQISIRNSTIVDLVMDGEFVESGTVFLYDSKYNEVIGSTDETRTEKLVAELEMEHADYAEYREWENVNLFGGVHKVRMQKIVNTDWILVSEYPSSYLWGLILEQYAVWLLAAALIGTLAAVFAVLFSRNLTGRIRLLDSHMTELAEGNGTYITESPGKDEIGSLIQNYNVTLKKLKQYMAKIIEDAKSLRVSELKLLQSQINPHFLYNTLDLIRWEALDHDAYRIADIVQALARFYKLSLNQGRETVPIEDEISHVESYVELQNYRYGGTISLEVQIPPELLEFTIVKITLQPLVENAIQHGLTDRKKTGEIVIDGWKEEGYIYLQVTDNGAGMSAEQVEHILKRKSSNDMHGFGIWNINERLRLQYGGKSGLYYESGEGTGTTVTVIIRAEK